MNITITQRTNKVEAGTVILQFPAHPKPWELTPRPGWVPPMEEKA